ncbi:FCD domain-containing protein [Mesorhizobium sp. B2-5-9]|uniref:FCD domain-containing protein n=1 Tax=Mesorhizobium sp. B2-5-9 TaxID=2589921 RepID=UPI0015E2DDE7|nr:FCD domain-containing protein [Mesorhizobium sp. B2-5-9]
MLDLDRHALFPEERRSIYCNEHQIVLNALLRCDSECASQAMLAHLRTVERNLIGR